MRGIWFSLFMRGLNTCKSKFLSVATCLYLFSNFILNFPKAYLCTLALLQVNKIFEYANLHNQKILLVTEIFYLHPITIYPGNYNS